MAFLVVIYISHPTSGCQTVPYHRMLIGPTTTARALDGRAATDVAELIPSVLRQILGGLFGRDRAATRGKPECACRKASASSGHFCGCCEEQPRFSQRWRKAHSLSVTVTYLFPHWSCHDGFQFRRRSRVVRTGVLARSLSRGSPRVLGGSAAFLARPLGLVPGTGITPSSS